MSKISRLLMMGLVVCAVMVVAGLNAQAGTVSQAISNEWLGPTTPVIFEDNDYGLWIDQDSSGTLNDGDLIIGIIRIQEISNGGSNVGGSTGIRDVPPTTGTQIGGNSGYNEVTAVFGGVITSSSPFTDPSTGDVVWSLKPVDSGTITFPGIFYDATLPAAEQVLSTPWTYTFVGSTGSGNTSMVDLWEDSSNDFTELDPSSAGNGTFAGGLGIASGATSDPDYGSNSAGEFWFVEDNSGLPLPDDFQMNLSLVNAVGTAGSLPSLFGWGVLPNDIKGDTGQGLAFLPGSSLNFGSGLDMFADGSFALGAGGWTFNSDGDFKVLFAPLPTAVWPAMLLLGALGLVRRSRRKTA